MEVLQQTQERVHTNNSTIGWTRRALNYRIPRRGANYTLFSIMADIISGSMTVIALIAFLGMSIQAFNTLNNIPVWLFTASVLLTRVLTFNYVGIYSSADQPRFISEVFAVVMTTLLSFLVLLGVFYIAQATVPLYSIIILATISVTLHVAWRSVVYLWSYYSTMRRILVPQRVIIIGATEVGRELADIISHFPLPTTRVVGFLDNNLTGVLDDVPIIGKLDDNIFEIIREHQVDEIILTTTRHVARNNSSAIVNLQHVPISVRLVPNYLKLNLYSVSADSLEQLPLVSLRKPAIPVASRVLKRALDLTVAALAFLAVLPIFAVIALLVWLEDRGPIFFKQERYGENGKIFSMLKFRSMVVNAEDLVDIVKITDEDNKTIYKRRDDPRITTIGKIIRMTSLDELPQLLNIIQGDMSLVGPRPEVRRIVETEYEPWQFERMRVPQGLTGWWQVTTRGTKECYTDTEKDIYYINNHSCWLDIKIILMTVPALLKAKGAF